MVVDPLGKENDVTSQGVQRRMVLVVTYFGIFGLFVFCFVVAIFDLVHDVEAI